MKFDYYMSCLAIEITRKCNKHCLFCARGDAQEVDITREIIDKTLSEVKGCFINTLRISGGEPLLKPDMICYLLNQIIEKHIFVNDVVIFTNGHVTGNSELANCICTFLNYLRQIESEAGTIMRWSNFTFTSKYSSIASKFVIIISDIANGRNVSPEVVNDLITYYSEKIQDDAFCIMKQSEDFTSLGQITLEGNAKRNYKDLIGDSISYINQIRILNNNYCFVTNSANNPHQPFFHNTYFVMKTLTVSANGNVFPGCSMSYIRVDNNPMFNILDCNKNFFEKVDTFCWNNPIFSMAKSKRNTFAAIEFCRKKGIKIKNMTKQDYILYQMLDDLINQYETIARDIHPMLPYLSHVEIDGVAIAILVNNLYEKKIPKEYIDFFLKECTDFGPENIPFVTHEWCRGFILSYVEKNKELAHKAQ